MRGLGTIINLCAVLAGGTIGLYAGDRLPERFRRTVMQAIGLSTMAVAIVGLEPLFDDDLGLRRAVIMVGGLTLGAVVGETLRLEERLEALGAWVRKRLVGDAAEGPAEDRGIRSPRFVEGFVVASTVFCVGPLTLLGAVEDGLGLSIRLLAIKSTLDGIVSIGFGSVYGVGALASLATIAFYQGGITAIATLVAPLLAPEVLAQLSVAGSILVLGIGIRLLEIKEIQVVNLLPAAFIAPAIAGAVAAFSS